MSGGRVDGAGVSESMMVAERCRVSRSLYASVSQFTVYERWMSLKAIRELSSTRRSLAK